MNMIFIKPAIPGSIVRHPEKINYKISQEGEFVENSIQWQRYLRDGDVVLAEPPIEKNKDSKPKTDKQIKGAQ
jgi:hypothetical protein